MYVWGKILSPLIWFKHCPPLLLAKNFPSLLPPAPIPAALKEASPSCLSLYQCSGPTFLLLKHLLCQPASSISSGSFLAIFKNSYIKASSNIKTRMFKTF